MPFALDKKQARVEITAWPHSSLPKRGFALFIAITWGMLMIPALALLGTFALWGLLPFLIMAIAGTWYFLQRSYRDRQILETLVLDHSQARLRRQNPRGADQNWHSNVHWVVVELSPKGGPVDNYLTLKGNGRRVEFGAFLTPGERKSLSEDLQKHLVFFKSAPGRSNPV